MNVRKKHKMHAYTIDDETARQLEVLSAGFGESKSAMLRMLIRNAFRKHRGKLKPVDLKPVDSEFAEVDDSAGLYWDEKAGGVSRK